MSRQELKKFAKTISANVRTEADAIEVASSLLIAGRITDVESRILEIELKKNLNRQ